MNSNQNNLLNMNKPMLNPRFHSSPEIQLTNDYRNQNDDFSNLSQQNLIDLIERDILAKIFSKVQSLELNDPNFGNQSLLQDINKNLASLGLNGLSSETLNQVGNMEQNNLNKGALNQLYNNLSLLLGKSKEKNNL